MFNQIAKNRVYLEFQSMLLPIMYVVLHSPRTCADVSFMEPGIGPMRRYFQLLEKKKKARKRK